MPADFGWLLRWLLHGVIRELVQRAKELGLHPTFHWQIGPFKGRLIVDWIDGVPTTGR
jgi:hypothetical protein